MTKNIIITSFLLATTLSAAAQQPTVSTESRKGELTVTYEAPIIKPSSDYATIVTPMICGQMPAAGRTALWKPFTTKTFRLSEPSFTRSACVWKTKAAS